MAGAWRPRSVTEQSIGSLSTVFWSAMDREGASSRPYVFPQFYQYAPYFTVQPVAETFSKQKELWSSLILSYCTCSNKTLLLPRALAVAASRCSYVAALSGPTGCT